MCHRLRRCHRPCVAERPVFRSQGRRFTRTRKAWPSAPLVGRSLLRPEDAAHAEIPRRVHQVIILLDHLPLLISTVDPELLQPCLQMRKHPQPPCAQSRPYLVNARLDRVVRRRQHCQAQPLIGAQELLAVILRTASRCRIDHPRDPLAARPDRLRVDRRLGLAAIVFRVEEHMLLGSRAPHTAAVRFHPTSIP